MKSWMVAAVVGCSLVFGGAGIAFGLVGMGIVTVGHDGDEPEAEAPGVMETARPSADGPTPRLIPFDDCYMGAGPRNCGIVHPDVILVCVDPGPSASNADCDQFEAAPLPSNNPAGGDAIPIIPREESPGIDFSDCAFDETYDFLRSRCVPGPLSCDYGERYDYLNHKCEVGPLSCGFGERYDYVDHKCEVSPLSCTGQEEYDFLRKRCVPKEPSASDCSFDEEFDYARDRCVPRGPSPSDCTFDERFDYSRDRCVPR